MQSDEKQTPKVTFAICLCVFSPSPASSGSGQALHRRGHSPLGAGRLRHLGQTPRGKPRARDGTASIQKFTPAGYFRPTRKQLLPLAPGFLRKHRQWGWRSAYEGKAKFRTGPPQALETDTSSLSPKPSESKQSRDDEIR